MAKPINLRALTWKDYGISEDRVQELKYFAMQYKEKKHKTRKSSKSPAAADDHRLQRMRNDLRIIEEAARSAAVAGGYPNAWKVILVSMAEDKNFQEAEAWAASKNSPLPWAQADFYAVRRAAFCTLDYLQLKSQLEDTERRKDNG